MALRAQWKAHKAYQEKNVNQVHVCKHRFKVKDFTPTISKNCQVVQASAIEEKIRPSERQTEPVAAFTM